jgi:hypothetical protein
LLVIGAQHRAFVDATVIGTTTVRVVRHSSMPVLLDYGRQSDGGARWRRQGSPRSGRKWRARGQSGRGSRLPGTPPCEC